MLFESPKILSILIDVSLRHTQKSSRILDHVKKALTEIIKTFDDDDGLYLYHPESIKVVYKRGEQIKTVACYETDGYKFDLGYAFGQTLYIAAAFPEDTRTVLYITDRYSKIQNYSIKKVLTTNEKLGCGIMVVGLGEFYDKEDLSSFGGIKFVHIQNPLDIELTCHYKSFIEQSH